LVNPDDELATKHAVKEGDALVFTGNSLQGRFGEIYMSVVGSAIGRYSGGA
jgi:hypothetical protein